MSTRCMIRIKECGGKIDLYHHHDGYFDGVGQELKNAFSSHGNALETLNALLSDDEYELTDSPHGDIEYWYLLDFDNGEFSGYHVPFDCWKGTDFDDPDQRPRIEPDAERLELKETSKQTGAGPCSSVLQNAAKTSPSQDHCRIIIEMTDTEDDEIDLFPRKMHPDDAGYDLSSSVNAYLKPGETKLIPAGFRMEMPVGYEAQIRTRSGNALKLGLVVLNSPGTVDAGYTGGVGVILMNAGSSPVRIARGDRIAQMVICKLPEVCLEPGKIELGTDRGEGGFGSTGRS